MHLAHRGVQSRLEVFTLPDRRTDFLSSLIDIYDEFKSSGVDMDELCAAADGMEGALGGKLRDISLIFSAYDAMRPEGLLDPREKLGMLAEDIGESSFADGKSIFIDGFTDFTRQELDVIDGLMKTGADITVCLTCDGLYGEEEQFELTRKTARRLADMAKKRGIRFSVADMRVQEGRRSGEMALVEESIFSQERAETAGEAEKIKILTAPSVAAECEMAAGEALEFVRKYAYRYRDIAIVARDWERYASALESILEKFGVPAMSGEKSDILEKPVMALIVSALDVLASDWEHTSVFKYLKTWLTGVERDEIDLLENYVLKWNIRGKGLWTREEGWSFDPEGFIQADGERHEETLARVNAARSATVLPLKRLGAAMQENAGATGKLKALYAFLEEIGLPRRLAEKTRRFRSLGLVQDAEEYARIWDIITDAMEQTAAILGGKPIESGEFIPLFKLVLSKYEVGTIPPALDRVSIGGMLRVRRRGVKCLILLGASDEAMPKYTSSESMLSDDDRAYLESLGFELSEAPDSRLARELNAIYSTLTMASDRLTVSYVEGDRPSFVVSKLEELFKIGEGGDISRARCAALLPLFELAVADGKEGDEWAAAALEYLKESGVMREKLAAVYRAAEMTRGKLSQSAAERLYSREINTTASRVEKFFSCRFAYFMQYGLKAKKRGRAELDAPEVGNFMHYLLENVTRDAKPIGGLGSLGETECRELTRKYAALYVDEVMDGFKDKSGRFKYLFSRLSYDAERIVLDMAAELKISKFEPLDFELDFSQGGTMPPAEISGDGVTVRVNGRVDRVDGWTRGDKLYLRVVDYKTGKKDFSLSDVADGLGIQMLLYLFALREGGREKYHSEVVPAGVLYAPARDVIVKASRSITPEKLEREREKALTRKGLILDDPEVVRAMEDSDEPRYIPIKLKKDGADGDGLASLEQFGRLKRHIDRTLLEMGREIRGGEIGAEPYFKSNSDNACNYCEYFEACHFDERRGDSFRRLKKFKPAEAWARIERGAGDGEK
ncbi:MAG: PD-(D/E)XK nuclease family protein [Oscillospiraceae bacterium]|nr:PD-(D/E)XK nuclease family protein [Oscillospiraceae bacterium]